MGTKILNSRWFYVVLSILLAVLWDRRVRRQQAISFCITAIAPEG